MPNMTTLPVDVQLPERLPELGNTFEISKKRPELAVGLPVVVTASDGRCIQDDLTQAVEYLRSHAEGIPPHGILVTRHSTTTFSVSFSSGVPKGTTRELDLLKNPVTDEGTQR